MFGNVRAYEGCALFRESIANHPKFRAWYERMKVTVLRGYKEAKLEQTRSKFFFLESVSDDDEAPLVVAKSSIQETKKTNESREQQQQQQQADSSASLAATEPSSTPADMEESSKNAKDLSELFIFRILTLNYLSHLIVFTYAAYAK